MTEFQSVNSYCHHDGEKAWVALILYYDKDRNISYSWFDGSEIDNNIIDSVWCDGYPLLPNKPNHTSHTYTNGSCWMNTFSTNETYHFWICGPSLSQPIACWISSPYLPGFLVLVVLINAIYIY